MAGGGAVDRGERGVRRGIGRGRAPRGRATRSRVAGRSRRHRRGRDGAGVAEPGLRPDQRPTDARGPGGCPAPGTPYIGSAGRDRGRPEAHPAGVRGAAGPRRSPIGRGAGGAGVRRHRRDRLRAHARRVGVVLDRRPARCPPRRAAGAGPQPVGVRHAGPAARQPAADPALALRCGADRPRPPRHRRGLLAAGRPLLGTCLAAMAMLLASPIAWSHHWVWAVPVAVVLWERSRWAAVAWTAVFVARPMLWPPWGEDREFEWGAADHLVGNAYVLAAIALAVGAAAAVRPRRSRSAAGRTAPLR